MELKNKILRTARIAVCVALTLLSTACTRNERANRLMVSVPAQQWALRQIAGDKFDVVCMADKAVSAESFDPDMQRMVQLETAAAYFLIGNLSFEETIAAKLKSDGTPVFDTSKGITLIVEEGGHSHGGHSGEADPHVWMSVRNMRVIAENMLQALVSLDADNRDYYTANFKRLDATLARLDATLSKRLSGKGDVFVVWHPSLTYFARDYGLRQISIEYEGKEAPAGYLSERIDEAKNAGAGLFFLPVGATDAQMRLAASMSLRTAELNPLAEDWESEINKIADEFTRQDN